MKNRRILAAITLVIITAVLLSTAAIAGRTAAKKDIAWTTDLNKALDQAKTTNKPLMVDFYADWCGPCKKMGSETFTDSRVVELSGKFISVKLNVDKNKQLASKYRVSGIPNIVFLNSNGREITRSVGFKNGSDFAKIMRDALAKAK